MADHTVDVLIAGQGAAGYTAGLYAARYGLATVICGDTFGGETATGGDIQNYPGWPSIDGFDLMLKFREQVSAYDVPLLDADLADIERASDCFISTLADGTTVQSAAVILAIGRERRRLGLANEAAWVGRGVSYCTTCDAPLYRGKSVAVVGGGDSAVEGALLAAQHADEVRLIYRGSEFVRPAAVLLERLGAEPRVEVLLNTEVVELVGEESGLRAIRVSGADGDQRVIDIDGLFVEIGADPRTAIAETLGVELNPATREVHVDRMMRTDVEGIFAAGDLTDGSGPLKQTVTAAAQGAVAALSAYQYVSEEGRRCAQHERGFALPPVAR